MQKWLSVLLLVFGYTVFAQSPDERLTIEKIMRDPQWIGTSPSNPYWSSDGKYLLFNWNPGKAVSDSLYYISIENKQPSKADYTLKQNLLTQNSVVYNVPRTAYVYSKDGDIFYRDIKNGNSKRITQTTDFEINPQFSFNGTKIVFSRNQQLFAWIIASGETMQLTNIQRGAAPAKDNKDEKLNAQEQWLKNDQLQYMQVLKDRKAKRDMAEAYNKGLPKANELRSIYIDDRNLTGLNISADGRFISYRLFKPATVNKTTIVPNYVTESGFTQEIPARSKVGSLPGVTEVFVYDREMDTVLTVRTDSIPGIRDLPDYVKEYPKQWEEKVKSGLPRSITVSGFYWSPRNARAVLDIRSLDNKDRWIMLLNAATGQLKLLDRQRDEAWIAGPGVGNNVTGGNAGWIDETIFWFQSETTGYSHLYTVNVSSGKKTALTSGPYEVLQAQLSHSKKYFYITTNEVHPGEQQFYRLPVNGGKLERITTMTGANQVTISPDEQYIAVLYSYSNKPWELYLQQNKPGGKVEQITNQAQSEAFKSYAWRDPEIVRFYGRDSAVVHARLFKPSVPDMHKPAIVFVHGAGYLQNAHKWWSVYFREFMFHNLLADNGYYVLDIDYRGSAGYGRNWRTGIYRHMGGKDLTDQLDGVKYLVEQYGVDPDRIGMYGGSYGGFITLMGMFTTDAFAAGAALRPVTDWAHYNHGYTANILNEPYADSIAYRRSSPIYHAEGLKGNLLICHGMVDVNVHFQDVVRLSQRLIELGKNNWELAVYPVEDHAFVEPSSWTDEYKRIFALFEKVLKK